MAKRKRHSADFKAKVALEAVRGMETSSEIASKRGVHPVQISQWKRQLLDHVTEIFEPASAGRRDLAAAQKKEAELYEQIGRLRMELEWLGKKITKLG